MDLVDAATFILATPTMLAGPHPSVVSVAYLFNALRPKTKFVGIIGSYGWGGRSVEILKSIMSGIKAEFLEPLLIKGHPKEEDFASLDKLADEIKEKHDALL